MAVTSDQMMCKACHLHAGFYHLDNNQPVENRHISIIKRARGIMQKTFLKYLFATAMASALSSCAFSPPSKKSPGSRFAVTCSSTDIFGQGKCDIDAKDFCENPPIATSTMSRPSGKDTSYTTWYYCP